jgi:hypothetical protein
MGTVLTVPLEELDPKKEAEIYARTWWKEEDSDNFKEPGMAKVIYFLKGPYYRPPFSTKNST